MSNCNDIADVLKRNGLDQAMRRDLQPDPDNLKLLGFGLEEWLKFARNLSENVSYFNEANAADGNWQAFFPDDAGVKTLLVSLAGDNKLTPHLALFVCFIYLLQDSTGKLNGISRRHLDFYYEEVLQIAHLEEQVDKVHVVFELARSFTRTVLDEGTELEGGKDNNGEKLIYRLPEEFVVGKAVVSQLKTVYNDPGLPVNGSYALRAAEVANSYDGKGSAFAGSDTSWYPFGYAGTPSDRPLLQDARIGFGIASHTLLLSEGERNVVIRAEFSSPVNTAILPADLLNNIRVFYTGEKGWEGPLSLSADSVTIDENTGAVQQYATGVFGSAVNLCVKLISNAAAAVPYSKDVHGGNYATQQPVFRFEVNTETQSGYLVYTQFTEPLDTIRIKVKVSGMRQMKLDSDTGVLNSLKPFFPFTTNPVEGAAFKVFQQEVFSKKWKHLAVNIKWKNAPENFRNYYSAYDVSFRSAVSIDWQKAIFVRSNINLKHYASADVAPLFYDSIVRSSNSATGQDYFKAYKSIEVNGQWNNSGNIALFEPYTDTGHTEQRLTFSYNGNYAENQAGSVKLTLLQSFLQELYPRIYALSLASKNVNTIVPNQPYVPNADEITIDYTATDELITRANAINDFSSRKVQLFHVHPFGECEEHQFLKYSFYGTTQGCSLVPKYCKGGELFIGLENALQLQQISMLVQVLEGSENPLADSFEGSQKVHWHILCGNNWKVLDPTLLIVNETDNFLKSGLVKFRVPVEATDDNTMLPPGLFWVKAKIHKAYDAVCRVLGIYAQAAVADFDNRDNELSHLEKGIPADSVTKLVNRNAAIKSVKQPYSSFGGRPAETDEQYYRRVSERLRHKHRAIALWDYEHIVLQEFPEIFKVKCLNHTCDCSFQSPGNVTLVVIPDVTHRTVFDRFQPRVSKAMLNRIDDKISSLNSLHVSTHVVNPDYEEIEVRLKAKFYDGLEENLYIDRLNDDICRYLSPWAFNSDEDIRFDEKLYLSVLVDFIDELKYVDYVEDVKILKNGVEVTLAEPSSPKSILVSARRHRITTNVKKCSTTNSPTESCQL